MEITAKEISQLLDGILEGNPDEIVSAPSRIEEGKPGTLTFLAHPKYEDFAYTTDASVLLVSEDFQPSQEIKATMIRVKDVYASLAILLEQFNGKPKASGGISPQAVVHETAKIGENVTIGPCAVIESGAVIGANSVIGAQVYIGEDVKIGESAQLYPGVKIFHHCQLGDQVTLHANVVIGCDGFGFVPNEEGRYQKIDQVGNVIIESEVEIGANTVIDRATMGSTIIRQGVKLDNLIQVAHNVEIGENTVIAAQAGIAGSTKLGKNCMVGGQAGFVGHIQIAEGTKVQAQSGVAASIEEPNQAVYGSPALGYKNYLKSYAIFKQLPKILQRLNFLEKERKEK